MPFTLVLSDASAERVQFACESINGDPDAICVQVAGEVDIATSPQLEVTLAEAQSQSRLVVLDLRELAFIDAIGVHAVIKASRRARRIDRRLVLLNGPPQVARMFTLSGPSEELDFGDPSDPSGAPSGPTTRRAVCQQGA